MSAESIREMASDDMQRHVTGKPAARQWTLATTRHQKSGKK